MKKCTGCKVEKPFDQFAKRSQSKDGLQAKCKDCNKLYRQANQTYYKEYSKQHYEDNLDYYTNRNKNYLENNPNYNANYYKENKQIISENKKFIYKNDKSKVLYANKIYYLNNKKYVIRLNNQYQIKRRKNDPAYKLRAYISTSIGFVLKSNNSSKNGNSILDFLPYTIQELKNHLEKQFEPWMNWKNWGIYDSKTWNDDDHTTWTWQLDHIIPHSEFYYTSTSDDNFKLAWDLSNLRPYSSKLNSIEGSNRKRHKK